MDWYSVVTGQPLDVARGCLPGDCCYKGNSKLLSQNILVNQFDRLIAEDEVTSLLSTDKSLFLDPSMILDDRTVDLLAVFELRMSSLVGNWEACRKESPLLQNVDEVLKNTDLELELKRDIGHLEAICRRPQYHLDYLEERRNIAQCKRVSSRALVLLEARSEDWEGTDFLAPKPKTILSVVRDETINTYENKIVATLIDRLIFFLESRVKEIEKVYRLISEAHDFEQRFYDMHKRSRGYRRIERISSLWGNTHATDPQKQSAEVFKKDVQKLYRRVKRLRGSILYKAIGQTRIKDEVLHLSNTFQHDTAYQKVVRLWNVVQKTCPAPLPQTVWDRRQSATKGFDHFSYLVVLKALEQLGFNKDESNIEESDSKHRIDLHHKSVGTIALEKTEKGTLVRLDKHSYVEIVSLPTILEQGKDIGDWWEELSIDSTIIASVANAAEKDCRDEKTIERMHSIRCKEDSTLAANASIAPWDLGSVEKVARLLRWHIWNNRFLKYPKPVAIPSELSKTLVAYPGNLRKSSDDREIFVLCTQTQKKWSQLEDLQKTLALQIDAKNKELISPKNKGRISLRLKQELDKLERDLASTTRLKEEIAAAELVAQGIQKCPLCSETTDKFEHTDEMRQSDIQVQFTCKSCEARWGLRKCNEPTCRKRFPYLKTEELPESCSGATVDDIYGSDVLALPAGNEKYHCPHCGS